MLALKNYEKLQSLKKVDRETLIRNGLGVRLVETALSWLNHEFEEEKWSSFVDQGVDYAGFYEVSNFGRVKSLSRKVDSPKSKTGFRQTKEKILNPSVNNKGYFVVFLRKDGVKKTSLVHRLVAQAFIPNPENKKEVNHEDADKKNNHISNLTWMTGRENKIHAIDMEIRGSDYIKSQKENLQESLIRTKRLKSKQKSKRITTRDGE